MRCDKCRSEAFFFQPSSGRHLCSRHLVMDIGARAKRSIRKNHWMSPGDHIAVLLTGDRQSAALLHFFHTLTVDRRDIRLSAAFFAKTGPGADGYPGARHVAESLGIPWGKIPSQREEAPAADDTVTKVAIAVTLDDIAHAVTERFLLGDADQILNPPLEQLSGIPVICPFITIPSEELDLYWEIEGLKNDLSDFLPVRVVPQQDIAERLGEYYCNHPGTRFALLHLADQLSGGRVAGTGIPGFTGQDTARKNQRSLQYQRPNS